MYFHDKEDVFQYVVQARTEWLTEVLLQLTTRDSGDIFRALLDWWNYLIAGADESCVQDLCVVTKILSQNSGMQQSGGMEMLVRLTERLSGAVSTELLNLQLERDLRDMLVILLAAVLPILWDGLRDGDASGRHRDRLENTLEILKRGMGNPSADNEWEENLTKVGTLTGKDESTKEAIPGVYKEDRPERVAHILLNQGG